MHPTNKRLPTTLTPLEPRLMLYSFSLDNGILRLTGDATSQSISVKLIDDKIRATLTEGSTQLTQQEWTAKSVSRIQIVCDAGDDRVEVSGKVKKTCVIGGGAGNDTLIGGGGNDTMAGTDGNDLIDGGGGGDVLIGGGGLDTVDYSSRTNDLAIRQDFQANDGEAGENDSVDAAFSTILCGSGDDLVAATDDNINGNNRIVGGAGDDTLLGQGGRDTLDGGGNDDTLDGGEESDSIAGESGNDTLLGGSGKDTLRGGSGDDFLDGGKSSDRLYGDSGNDRFRSKDDSVDRIDGGSGTDSVLSKDRNDVLSSI